MARRVRTGQRGFTLIEVVIVLAILSIIVAMLAPMAFQLLTAERSTALENELQEIYTAIVGNPEKNIFGYVGDVGNYPTSLHDLVRQPTMADGVTPLPGWKGPYVQNPRIENNVWIDPLARPYEYFLVNGSQGTPDQLAILSRGPDGVSSNTSTTPNVSSSWLGLNPTDSGYLAGTNVDNVAFPRLDANNANVLSVRTDGDVALNILNWDNNPKINNFVPACPQLFTVTATSVPRGTVEASTYFSPGLAFNLAQGQYRMAITPQGIASTSWAETFTIMPGTTLTRTINLSGLDSSGTPLYNLTVKNGFTATELEVWEFDSELSGVLPGTTSSQGYLKVGETRVYTPHACAQMYIKEKGKTTIKDQFVMPYGAFTRQLGTQAATLLVINLCCHTHHDHGNDKIHHHDDEDKGHHYGHYRLFVYRNDILIGTVNHHHKREFKDLMAGDKITMYDKFGVLHYTNTSLPVGTTTVTVTN